MENNTDHKQPQNASFKYKKQIIIISSGLIILTLITGLLLLITQKSKITQTPDINIPTSTTPTISPTPTAILLPIISKEDEKILSAVRGTDCFIEITTNYQSFSVQTESAGMEFSCKEGSAGKISPSGKYIAYGDSSGGIDSRFALFILDYGKDTTLGVWGTSSILDYMFLPDDRLVVISGYPDIYDEQNLSLFDIPIIVEDFSNNFDPENFYLSNTVYQSSINLPNTNTTHNNLSFKDGLIKITSDTGRLLVQYKPKDIIMNSGYVITPAQAKSLVSVYEQNNLEESQRGLVKPLFDQDNSTNNHWVINMVDHFDNQKILRKYLVDRKTGKVLLQDFNNL